MGDTVSMEWMDGPSFSARFGAELAHFPAFGTAMHFQPGFQFLCAMQDGHLAGFAKVYIEAKNTNWHIELIEVSPEAQHQGVARQIIDTLFEDAQAKNVELTSNGFTEQGKSHLLRIFEQKAKQFGKDSYSSFPSA